MNVSLGTGYSFILSYLQGRLERLYLYCDKRKDILRRELPRPKGSGYISLYILTLVTIQTFSFSNNGSAAAVEKAAQTAVTGNVDPAVAVELITSVEDI